MMYINTMVALSANTPGADGSLVEWALFIFNKYSTLFLKATWVTLYVALIGTLLGFILGFAVGIINTVKRIRLNGEVRRHGRISVSLHPG